MADSELIAEAKVCNLDVQVSFQKHALWLYVPVDNTFLVVVLHGGRHLAESASGLPFSHARTMQ